MADERISSGQDSEPGSSASPSPDDIAHAEALASWKKIQTNTFIRWANEHLREAGGDPIVDLAVDFSDGVLLITLIEALSRKKFPSRYSRQPVRRNQQLENVTLVLEFLEKEEKIRLVNIDSSDIVDGNTKLILGLMWSLILHYSISRLKWDDETNTDQEKKTDLTPKQRLLTWIQNKLPEQNITNFTTDWNDGRNIGALVDSVAPGLCPDWHLWEPDDGLENARKAMTIAEEWLGVPQLITPDELTDPKLDEQSAMTYLSGFPSAKPKSSICIRRSGGCAVGPGVVGLPLEFFINTLDEDDISNATVKIIDPAGFTKEFDRISTENTRSLCIQFRPEADGMHKMVVNVDNSQKLPEGVLTFDVKGSVAFSGPGLERKSVAPLRETYFEVHSDDMKIKDLEVKIVQPDSVDKSVLHSDISKMPDGQWRVEFTPLVEGPHLVNVFVNGVAVNGSPYNMSVSSECTEPISIKGRGVQPSGLRVGDDAVVILEANDTYAEGNHETLPFEIEKTQQSKLDVSSLEVTVSDPDGAEVHGISEKQENRLKYTYRPERVGKFVGAAKYRGQSISGSPFGVNVGPAVACKSHVFGSGLHSGIVGHRACFTVDCHKDEIIKEIHVNGPQPVEVVIKENVDGSKDVSYIPLSPGEHAVHILFNDNEDIPGSPFMVDVITAVEDFNPTKVLAYGNGLSENGIPVDEWTEFTVDTTLAGQDAKLCIEVYDDDCNKLEVHMNEGDWPGAVECQYKPQKPGQYKIFISYGGVSVTDKPFRVQVHDNPASGAVEELPVEATTVKEVSSQMDTLDYSDISNEEQALHVKAYGDGLGSGYAGHLSNFIVVMSNNCGMECLGVAVDGPCKVEMDCIETKEGYKFSYIPRTAGEFIISINYAGKYPIPGSPFHVFIKEATNMYRVCVYTGDKLFAGTDANVYITLYGEIGDTGPMHLKASRTHLNKFERNQVDEFFVEAVNIGELRRIKMGHDNSGVVGTSWFLAHVEIESPLLGRHWVFPFNCWLAKNGLSLEVAATIVDDTRLIPEFSQDSINDSQETGSSTLIVPCENTLSTVKHNDDESVESASNSGDGVGNYHVNIYTGDKLFAGTDAKVHIEIFGEKGGTGILELESSKKNWNKFERNKKSEFVLDVPDVGELFKIRIGHDNSGLFGSSWFLDRVEVESKLLGKMWHFPFHQWLSKEKHGCKPEAELFPHQIVNANKLSGSVKISEKSNVPDDSVKVSGLGLEGQLSVNVSTSFLVDVSDADPGNLLLLSVQGPSEPCPVNMTYEENGIYNVSYKPQEKGEYVISIRWGNQSISGSPFVVTVG